MASFNDLVATAYFDYNHVTASPNAPAIRWANFYGAPPTVEYGEVSNATTLPPQVPLKVPLKYS